MTIVKSDIGNSLNVRWIIPAAKWITCSCYCSLHCMLSLSLSLSFVPMIMQKHCAFVFIFEQLPSHSSSINITCLQIKRFDCLPLLDRSQCLAKYAHKERAPNQFHKWNSWNSQQCVYIISPWIDKLHIKSGIVCEWVQCSYVCVCAICAVRLKGWAIEIWPHLFAIGYLFPVIFTACSYI